MLFFICAIVIGLNNMNDINISWWFLIPSTLVVLFAEMLEGILFYKEVKNILKEKKLTHKPFLEILYLKDYSFRVVLFLGGKS